MATASVTNTFVLTANNDPSEVNKNFQDVVDFLNNQVTHVDGSKAFTSVPSGPAADPTSDNQLSRKKYVDDQITARASMLGHTHDTRYYTQAQVDAITYAFSAITGTVADSQLPELSSWGDSGLGMSFNPVVAVDWSNASYVGMDLQFVTETPANAKTFVKCELSNAAGTKTDVGTWKWTGTHPQITAGGSGVELEGYVTAVSDRRMKENLQDYTVDLDGFLSIGVFEYDYIGGGRHAVGPIAQDVRAVFPELVSTNWDGMLQIDQQSTVGMLWAVVRELVAARA